MTGAQAAAAALVCEAAPCVFGVPGAQNNDFWDAMKSAGLPYLLVTNEASASVMADGSARSTGGVGVFSVVPGPGLTNALTGIGEALLDSSPIVGIVTDIDRRPTAPSFQVHSTANAAILRPICKQVYEAKHQAQIPVLIHDAFRMARSGEPGPVAVVIPFQLYNQVWDYDGVAPPPYPVAFDEGAYRRAVAVLGDRRARVGIYAGGGCADVGPGAGVRRRDPSGSGGDLGQRQGGHRRLAPPGGRLGVWCPGNPGGGKGVQGGRHRPGGRGEVQRELDGELRDPPGRQGDPRRRLRREHRAERADMRRGQRRLAVVLRPA